MIAVDLTVIKLTNIIAGQASGAGEKESVTLCSFSSHFSKHRLSWVRHKELSKDCRIHIFRTLM